ncbi:MAG: hypothetical protein KME46_32640 [Brasilonema angustatum HA4187-MV1]|jgi:hypothetical protein|nr:hypothetical protein [Brasilonema angustatum HA4187-MV1]
MEKTQPVAKQKGLFIGLSFLSIGCLFASFSYPLQNVEVWKQRELNQFQQPYDKVFILTDSDLQAPYGLNKDKAFKVSQIYRDYKFQKILVLLCGLLAGGMAMLLGEDAVQGDEIDVEVKTIDQKANKEFLLTQVKHKWAMLSEAQKQLFREEIRALAELAGGDDTADMTEINVSDKFIQASYLMQDGEPIDTVVSKTWGVKEGTKEHDYIKAQFEKWLNE